MSRQRLFSVLSRRATRWILAALCVAVTLAFVAIAQADAPCKPIYGKLVKEHIEGWAAVARMTGAIHGDYSYWMVDKQPAWPEYFPTVSYVTGISQVVTKDGELWFLETSTSDSAGLGNVNGAVLMTIFNGTGQWAGATGHVVLTGYFHGDTQTGSWDYQGELCNK